MHTLIFVYNANSGLANSLLDIGHKLLSPSTYQCSLCALTHGVLTEQQSWKDFRQRTQTPLRFLHKDEFEREFKHQAHYPLVLAQSADGALQTALSTAQLSELHSLDDLIDAVQPWLEQ